MQIAIVIFEGFDELDAIAPYEVFENAAAEGASVTTTLCTLNGIDEVIASHGLRVNSQARLDDLSPDLILVPGGQWNTRGETGAWAEAERGDLPRVLTQLAKAGVVVAGVCTGGMILARAGLMKGRPATTHTNAMDDLRKSEAEVIDALIVDDGDLLTAGGVTSGLDLAIYIVQREFGVDVANAVAERMEYELRGPVYRSD